MRDRPDVRPVPLGWLLRLQLREAPAGGKPQ
jgi:hypothetical protein